MSLRFCILLKMCTALSKLENIINQTLTGGIILPFYQNHKDLKEQSTVAFNVQ